MTTPSSSRLSRLLRGIGALIVAGRRRGRRPAAAGEPAPGAAQHPVAARARPRPEAARQRAARRRRHRRRRVDLLGAVHPLADPGDRRRRPQAPCDSRCPASAVFQRPAGALVSAIAIGFTIAPLIAGVATAGRAAATPPPLPASPRPRSCAAPSPGPTSATPAPAGMLARRWTPRTPPLADHTTPRTDLPGAAPRHPVEDRRGPPGRPDALPGDHQAQPRGDRTGQRDHARHGAQMPADATGVTPPRHAGARRQRRMCRSSPATRCGTSRSGSPGRARTGPPAGRRTRAAPSRAASISRPEPDPPGMDVEHPDRRGCDVAAGHAPTSPGRHARRTRRRRRRRHGHGRQPRTSPRRRRRHAGRRPGHRSALELERRIAASGRSTTPARRSGRRRATGTRAWRSGVGCLPLSGSRR